MVKPIIMTIDDEPHVLNAIARDLQARYQRDYRIVKAGSGEEALDAVKVLKERNEPIALFLADQRMPSMSGIEFFGQALANYPQAKKVMLTAYADTDAAIASINDIGLDYYLMKPWDPPEECLYPVLDDLLSDWHGSVTLPYEGIRVAGTLWSSESHHIKDFLARSQIPYQWLDIDKDEKARAMVDALPGKRLLLPAVFFPDGSMLAAPDLSTLAEKVGLKTHAQQPFYDLVIIGAGPAGLTAAVYAASEGLRTIVIERDAAGGQAGTSARIENYLGFPNGISGADLTRRAITQAKRLGAEIVTAQEVTGVRCENSYRYVRLSDETELSCHALLIATGVALRKLEVPGIEHFIGGSVYYGAATSEAVYYRDKEVFVVGGANSAGQGAMFLSRFAKKVVMLHRSDSLEKSMSKYLIDQIDGTKNITTLMNSEVSAVGGEEHVEEITIRNNKSGEQQKVPADAVFIFIGAVPSTEIVGELIKRDKDGFILTGPDLMSGGQRPNNWKPPRDPFLLETSVPGIFAAGDVRHGAVRRVASAVGQGAVAVSLIHKYLETV